MDDLFEIYFSDLTENAQRRFLEFEGVTDSSELNAEFSPIAIVDKDVDREVK